MNYRRATIRSSNPKRITTTKTKISSYYLNL